MTAKVERNVPNARENLPMILRQKSLFCVVNQAVKNHFYEKFCTSFLSVIGDMLPPSEELRFIFIPYYDVAPNFS
jgi:hypothetical protein